MKVLSVLTSLPVLFSWLLVCIGWTLILLPIGFNIYESLVFHSFDLFDPVMFSVVAIYISYGAIFLLSGRLLLKALQPEDYELTEGKITKKIHILTKKLDPWSFVALGGLLCIAGLFCAAIGVMTVPGDGSAFIVMGIIILLMGVFVIKTALPKLNKTDAS